MTYPLTMPLAPGFTDLVILPEAVTARSQSPFTLRGQTVVWQGKRLRFTCTLPTMKRALGQQWAGFFTALNGREGTFTFQPSKALMGSSLVPYIDITPPAGAVNGSGITTVTGRITIELPTDLITSATAAGVDSAAFIGSATGRETEWTGTAVRVYGGIQKTTSAGIAYSVTWDNVAPTSEVAVTWPKLDGQGDGGEIETDGWPESTQVVATGQWLKIGSRLHKALADASSDGDGKATLNVWPHLNAVADNTDVIYGEPVTGTFRLDQDAPEIIWQQDLRLGAITFTCIEADP